MLTEYPNLSQAPIVEALLDLRTTLSPETDVQALREASPGLRESYPSVRTQRGILAKLSVSGGDASLREVTPSWTRGFMFSSPDNLYRVQFRQDGFTFNRLKPYTNWGDFVGRARQAWNEYIDIAQPNAVTRVAVRYINRFELTVPVDLSEYLVSTPELPPNVPQDLASFLWRWVVRDEGTGIMCNLSQAAETVSAAQKMGIVLDIDCYVDESLEPQDERIWERLAQLRELKNRIFFNSVTSRSLEMFS